MNSGYYPKVLNPNLSNSIPQMKSEEYQLPFFFGGSQVPTDLGLPVGSFSGSGMSKMKITKVKSFIEPVNKPVILPFRK
jgi:hypothetical protein